MDGDDGTGGAVGDGTTTNRLVPTGVLGLTGAVQLTAGGLYSCALRAGGDAFCWGDIVMTGALGDGTATTRLVPTPVPDLTDAVELRAGSGHTCARLGSGGVRCWGGNADGQVGDDTTSGVTSSRACTDRNPCRLAPTDVVDISQLSAMMLPMM